MADPQSQTDAEDTNSVRKRSDRETTPGVAPQGRSFATAETAPHGEPEGFANAKEISNIAARATREVGEQGRQVTRDAVASWQGAVEPFMAIHMELNRLFDDLWRQTTGFGIVPAMRTARPFSSLGAATMLGLPPTDLKETDKGYVLCSEVPGLTRNDVEIQIRGDTLMVSGQKGEASEDVAANYRLSERRFGRFDRSFPIPPDVVREGIKATVREGVLTIMLPKSAGSETQRTKIEVQG